MRCTEVSSEPTILRVDLGNTHLLDTAVDDVFDDDIDHARLGRLLEAGQLVVIAVADGAVVGQVQGMVQHHVDGPPQLYIDNLGVSSNQRRKGIARRLVEEIIAWSHDAGCVETWIVTDLDNHAANSLYQSLDAERSHVALYSLDHRP